MTKENQRMPKWVLRDRTSRQLACEAWMAARGGNTRNVRPYSSGGRRIFVRHGFSFGRPDNKADK